jgi:hypothetical protein
VAGVGGVERVGEIKSKKQQALTAEPSEVVCQSFC